MKRRSLIIALIACFAIIAVTGLLDFPSEPVKAAGKQEALCYVRDLDGPRSQCTPGAVLLYAPETFGNQQLPVIFASIVCDFSRPIVWTVGGVACVFTDARLAAVDKVFKPQQ